MYLANAGGTAFRITRDQFVDIGVPFQRVVEIGDLIDVGGCEQQFGRDRSFGNQRLYRIGIVGVGPHLSENIAAGRVEKSDRPVLEACGLQWAQLALAGLLRGRRGALPRHAADVFGPLSP